MFLSESLNSWNFIGVSKDKHQNPIHNKALKKHPLNIVLINIWSLQKSKQRGSKGVKIHKLFDLMC